jgi:hypothetical protein
MIKYLLFSQSLIHSFLHTQDIFLFYFSYVKILFIFLSLEERNNIEIKDVIQKDNY